MKYIANIVVLLLVMSLLHGCEQKNEVKEVEEIRPVRTYLVGSSDSVSQRSFPGVVDAKQKATLSFRISGKLNNLSAREGMLVKEGDVLATLDDQDVNIELADAKANFDRASADFKRASLLVDKGHVSRSDFDKLKASKASAAAHLASVKKKLEYSTLRAPFSGQIAKRYLQNYQDISAAQPVYLLQDLSELEIKVDLPASVMLNAEKERGTLNIYARFEELAERRFPLKVKEVATVADDVTQTYSVTLGMTAVEGYSILPGMTATVSAEVPQKDDASEQHYVIPSHAVVGSGSKAFVWVAAEEKEGFALVKKTAVQIGEARNGGLEILTGIERNQLVVTAGMSKLTEGQKVRLPRGQAK